MTIELFAELLRWIIVGSLIGVGLLVIQIWVRNKTRRISILRIFIQTVSLVAIYYLFTMVLWFLVVLLVILLSTIFLGRFFCGWICPFGFYMDIVTIFRKTIKIRYFSLPDKLNRLLNKLRYLIFGIILSIPFLSGPIFSQSWQLALFFVGSFKPLSILLGPLEPLIVPGTGALVVNGINLTFPYVRDVIFYSSGFFIQFNSISFVILTLMGSFIIRRVWCRFCPLGLSFVILNKIKGFKWIPLLHITKMEEKCTKCGICKRVCPPQVTEVYDDKSGNVSTSMCVHCFRCVEMCPYEDCLKVNFAGKTILNSRNWLEPSEDQ